MRGKRSAVESGESVENADNFGDFIGSNVFWDDDDGTTARAEGDFLATLSWLIVLGLGGARLFEMKVVRVDGFSRGSREREGRGRQVEGAGLSETSETRGFEEGFGNRLRIVFGKPVLE